VKLGVVILGAGASRRMGRPKLLLPWNGKTVIEHLMDQWISLGAHRVAIVVSGHNIELNRELDRLGVPDGDRIVNPEPEEGMFSSIRCAARREDWSADLTHVVISLGDQPHLKSDALRQLMVFATQNSERICQPSLKGRAKHPVCLPRGQFSELALTDAPMLKHFLEQHQELISLIELEDEGLSLDLDTPEDYEKAVRKFGDQ